MELSKTKSSVSRLVGFVLACCFLADNKPASAADFFVSNASQINTAMQSAQPGDTLIMANGTWTNEQINFAGFGNAANPITLRAETPGQVILNGSSRLSISGDSLVVDGLNFVGGALSSGNVVEFRGSNGEATNSRFTNSAIVDYNPADINTRYFWVSLYGESNRVDNNFFSGQSHSGVTVTVWRGNSDPDFHQIDNNYFADRPTGNGNGFETIRIGTSAESLSNSFTVVENNLFERTDGEIEIISNKSGSNTFRYNTFREAAGTLTLRHGNDNLVEGNFFLGEGKNQTGGVRVIGEGQTLVNNYFHDLDGRANGAISISAGVSGSALNEYFQVKDAVIAHNTIVDVKEAAIRFDDGLGSSSRTLLADDVTIANNLINTFQDPVFEGSQGSGWVWEGNIVNANSLGDVSSMAGINEVDPQLSADANGIFRLTSSASPAVNAAVGNYSSIIVDDMDGQPRMGIFDVGADEFSNATIVRAPLEAEDVGPAWLLDPPVVDPPSGVGGCGPNGCAIQAEDYSSILDPDNDNNEWTVETVVGALGDQVLKAPGGDRVDLSSETHDTIAVFELEFETAGTYTFYYRARGFSGSTDSLYTPDSFNIDPNNNESLSNNGVFEWITDSVTFSITESNTGVPLEFRLGMRERDTELDAIVLHLNPSLSDAELDSLFNPLAGDYNGDGLVDAADFVIWRDSYGQTGTGLAADGDGSGEVDQADYTLWVGNFGSTSGPSQSSSNSTSVPEPASLIMILIGLISAASRRQRA